MLSLILYFFSDRRNLEEALAKDSNEALLLDETTQDVYEGLSSNFFALDRNTKTVVTAPLDSVLTGTILKVVLNVCEQHKIPVKFAFPNLKHVDDWEGAFISSKCGPNVSFLPRKKLKKSVNMYGG